MNVCSGGPAAQKRPKHTQGGCGLRYSLAMLVLFCAACLEAGGDALVRVGLRGPSLARSIGFILLGGVALTFYGAMVNAPRWEFGRLLGVYIAFFLVVAQLIAWLGFGQKPSPLLLLGGALIVAGGFVVSLAS